MKHGTRSMFVNRKCRCLPCRAANSDYQNSRRIKMRDGKWNPFTSASRVRKHLLRLSQHGVGKLTVSEITGIPIYALWSYKTGRTKSLRAEREQLILGVTRNALSQRTLLPAKKTLRMMKGLKREGFTHRLLAERLGVKVVKIGRKPCVRAESEMRIEKLYNRYVTAA